MEKGFEDAHDALPQGPHPSASDGQVSMRGIDVFRVGVRVPPFWPEEPDIWFAQIEGQFAISGIKDDNTKFNYVIAHLDMQHSREVKDIIVNPPPTDKYARLKSELIKRLSASKENKLKQLLMHEELGDRKPSQFLRHLQSLASTNIPDDFLRTIWISRLPHGIQTVLAGQPACSLLEDLADLADRVNDLASSSPKVAAVDSPVPGSVVNDLAMEVAELRKQLQHLTVEKSDRRHNRGRSRSRGSHDKSRQRSQSNYRKFPLCWYHSNFGDKAAKCIRPCDYKPENSKGGR